MRFNSKRDIWISIVVWGAIALLASSGVEIMQHGGAEQWFVLLVALIAGMLLWMWLGTYYVIEDKELRYRSGPINGVIDIGSIHTVIISKSQYVGLKPALAAKGCIIKYNKFEDIYISPKDKDLFVDELLKVNPAIEVVKDSQAIKANHPGN
ncbi:PH domain-containing protein [Mucilaginibacter sp. PAMB04168]|uniref:PH domain-containing protein n=1 Tax=Mucilaginibacter sp. PAMB04168 TaxID=3138567 RepID=UPI0031F605BE